MEHDNQNSKRKEFKSHLNGLSLDDNVGLDSKLDAEIRQSFEILTPTDREESTTPVNLNMPFPNLDSESDDEDQQEID